MNPCPHRRLPCCARQNGGWSNDVPGGFSTDRGKTWEQHHVITDAKGFNYTAIREVRPGRLLYVHNAPNMRALYVDVESLK